MSVKIRLQRFGRKGRPIYHIVVADARAPRDGRYITRLGSYNPNTNPATIDLSVDDSVQWIRNGAQPTDTCRAILSYKGVMMKKHLQDGVAKGAFSAEEAESRFGLWLQSKEERIDAKKSGLKAAGDERRKARMAAESKLNQERAAALIAKKSALAAELEAAARAAAAEAAGEDADATSAQQDVETPVMDVHEPVAVATEDHEPVAVATEDHEPVAVATEDHEPVAVATEDHEPAADATEDHEPLADATEDHEPVASESTPDQSAEQATGEASEEADPA
jgi:small subunit ribosomal protein S16